MSAIALESPSTPFTPSAPRVAPPCVRHGGSAATAAMHAAVAAGGLGAGDLSASGQPSSTYARPTARRTPLSWGVFGELNREWEATLRETPLPSSWRRRCPALKPHDTCGDLLDSISRRRDPGGIDKLLYSLLQLHAGGHELAGRLVLQSMLGKVHRLSHTARKKGYDDPHQSAISAMWVTIERYPLHRSTSVAGNLALDALALLSREAPTGPAPLPQPVDAWLVDAPASLVSGGLAGLPALPAGGWAAPGADEGDTLLEDPFQILYWAHEQGAITAADHELLSRVYLCGTPTPPSLRQLAAEMGISDAAIWQRHARALRALVKAVRTHLLGSEDTNA